MMHNPFGYHVNSCHPVAGSSSGSSVRLYEYMLKYELLSAHKIHSENLDA